MLGSYDLLRVSCNLDSKVSAWPLTEASAMDSLVAIVENVWEAVDLLLIVNFELRNVEICLPKNKLLDLSSFPDGSKVEFLRALFLLPRIFAVTKKQSHQKLHQSNIIS